MTITEDQLEQKTIAWLRELGFSYAYGPDIAPAPEGTAPEREDYRQVILAGRLRAQLETINPTLPLSAIEDAVRQVLTPNLPTLIQINRQFHRWLRDGVKVQYQRDGETVGDQVRLIDFTNPMANDWLAVNQFTIKGPNHTKRPDIILFVNGLPFVVLELKNPADEEADIWAAFNQLQTYKAQIPDLFNTNELMIISDGITARVGSLTADKERFSAWRTIDGRTVDPLGAMRELETMTKGLLSPAFLCDYLNSFILFEEDDDGNTIKKIAGYHQAHAVRLAVEKTITASAATGDKRAGVVWHTQGSGKSISMACYAGKVMTEPAMKNPTILVVTDRNDLDGQLLDTFTMSKELLREAPVQADDRDHLRQLLANRPSGGIIFTTIQKFSLMGDEATFPLLTYARGLYYGFQGDYVSAAHILMPQVEASLRHILKEAGFETSKLNAEGLQEEKTLTQLFQMEHLSKVFGPDMLFELRGLLDEKSGDNFRNLLLHGLQDDDDLSGSLPVYFYWLVLHLVCVPLNTEGLDLNRKPYKELAADCIIEHV
jgi:type I restriction enzyme R subunit